NWASSPAGVTEEMAGGVGMAQPGGMAKALGCRAPRPVGESHLPEHERKKGEARSARVGHRRRGDAAISLRIIEGRDGLELRTGGGERAKLHQGRALRPVTEQADRPDRPGV